MTFQIELDQEADGRWLAEVPTLPGVMTYGVTPTDAVAKVQALALRVLAKRLEQGEAVPELLTVTFQAACAVGAPPRRAESSRHSSGLGGRRARFLAILQRGPIPHVHQRTHSHAATRDASVNNVLINHS
jgi:predicted RNase H-like HicB family nuclease